MVEGIGGSGLSGGGGGRVDLISASGLSGGGVDLTLASGLSGGGGGGGVDLTSGSVRLGIGIRPASISVAIRAYQADG